MQTSQGLHMINNVSFSSPETPVLLQILKGQTDPEKLLPKGSVYKLPAHSTIEINMPGGFPVCSFL